MRPGAGPAPAPLGAVAPLRGPATPERPRRIALPLSRRSPELGPARGAPAPDALRAGAGTRATARSSPPAAGPARPGAPSRHSGDKTNNRRDDARNAAALAGR